MHDFNDADKQGSSEPIPAKTVVRVAMKIKPGGYEDGGWITASKSSDARMIAAEFVVIDGPYVGRRWWQYMVVSGGKLNDKGQSIAGNISRQTLRAILESARNINPDDQGPEAVRKRQIVSWGDFNGMGFLCRVGIEKDKTGQYDDKNKIAEVITPDMPEYSNSSGVGHSMPPPAFIPQPQQPPSNVPAWAR